MHQFLKVQTRWETEGKAKGRQTERGDWEGEQTSVSTTSTKIVEKWWDSQGERWMEKDREERGEKSGGNEKEERVLDREETFMPGVSSAGSEVLMTGRDGASGGLMWASVRVYGCHFLMHVSTLLFQILKKWIANEIDFFPLLHLRQIPVLSTIKGEAIQTWQLLNVYSPYHVNLRNLKTFLNSLMNTSMLHCPQSTLQSLERKTKHVAVKCDWT